MFKIITKTVISALGIVVISSGTPVVADDGPDISVTFTGATDYIFRGVSQTNNNAGVFSSINAGFGNGFYVGAGIEDVDFGNSVDAEYDIWAGWSGKLNNFDLNLQVVRFGYVGSPSGLDLDTYELKVGVSRSFNNVTLGVAAHFTTDYFAVEEAAQYYEAFGSLKINDKWSTSAGVGKQVISNSAADYTTWNIGASYAATDNITLDLRFTDTDVNAGGDLFNNHIVFSLKVGL